MITPYIFAQLLKNPSKREGYYNSFLNKYKTKFDKAILIRFSAKKYEDVHVDEFFFHQFEQFVIDDLASLHDDISFESWVCDLAERRVKAIRHKVDREVAKILTQKGGQTNWGIACEIVWKEFQDTITKVVSKCFGDEKYKEQTEDVKTILIGLFYMERAGNPTPINHIDNFEGWLYTCLFNLANRRRSEIDTEIITRNGTFISIDTNEACVVKKASTSLSDYQNDDSDYEQSGDSDTENESNNIRQENDVLEIADNPHLVEDATVELERLLALMSNVKYAELIRAIKIEGVPVETMAEEWGCTNAAIYNIMNEAMTMLVKVALPQIRARNYKMYKKSIYSIETGVAGIELSDYEKLILKEFFEDGIKVKELATQHRKMPSVITADLRKSFDKLKKLFRNLEPEEYPSEEEERAIRKLNDLNFWNY